MDELVYKSLVRYFKVLGELGYIRYTDVYRLIVLIHLQELINSSAKYFITENDCRLMQETLYTLTGSTCLISFPYQRCSCSGSYTPVTPSPSFDSFTLDIPASINGSKVYSGNRIATFSISNINYVAADTLSIIDVTNNKTLASGLSIVSPVTADLGTLTFAGGKSYQFKATVKGTDGNTYTSPIYTVVCSELVPSISGFSVNITSPQTGDTTITGSKTFTFTITNPETVQANSLSLYVGDTLIANNLSIVSPITQSVTLSMKAGNTYNFKATVKGTDGNTYTSNIYSVVCKSELVPSISGFSVNITSPQTGDTTITGSKTFTFTITNPETVQANSLSLYVGDTLIANNLSIVSPITQSVTLSMKAGNTYNFKATVLGTNGNTYTSNIYSVVCKAVSTVYYGEINSAAEVTSSVITAGSTVDGSTVKTFNAPWDTKVGQFIAIPSVYSLKTIVNSVITSDVWYDATTSIYTEQDMTINNTSYKVYYSIKPMPMGEDGIVTIA